MSHVQTECAGGQVPLLEPDICPAVAMSPGMDGGKWSFIILKQALCVTYVRSLASLCV